jgi:malonyl-CoA/methylmalonyl-CoA synthetase
MSENLLHALYDHRDPQSEAYSFQGTSISTTGDLRRAIGRMAQALYVAGVVRGDRVSVRIEKSEEALFVAHACLQLGAVLHPLNTAYTDTEVAYLVKDAEPRLLICQPDEEQRLGATCDVQIMTLAPEMGGSLGARAAKASPLAQISVESSSDIAALLYTSGTTGRPKGACITHGNLTASARALAQVWALGPSDRLLHALPLYHAHGLLTAIDTLMVARGSILFLPRFDEDEVLAALPETTVIMGVPTHYARLLKKDGLAEACRKLRLVISGSAPLSREISDRFLGLTGKRIIERYGATETAIVAAVPAGEDQHPGFVGWALPGVAIRVSDTQGNIVERATMGSLETKGHNVFAGYWRRPEADAEAFTADGWFVTGDIARIDETGCIQLLGRSKDMIISGGLNVYPKEVEDCIDTALPGCESAVFGVPHPDFGEAVVAVVERCREPIDETSLIGVLREHLAPYKLPKRIFAVASIPRNKLGKVRKSELRVAHRNLFV